MPGQCGLDRTKPIVAIEVSCNDCDHIEKGITNADFSPGNFECSECLSRNTQYKILESN